MNNIIKVLIDTVDEKDDGCLTQVINEASVQQLQTVSDVFDGNKYGGTVKSRSLLFCKLIPAYTEMDQEADRRAFAMKQVNLAMKYVLIKSCHAGDGTLDWKWARDLVDEKLNSLQNQSIIEQEVQRRLAEAEAVLPPTSYHLGIIENIGHMIQGIGTG